jgi:Ricin-type beta-trefoil lectin domain
MRTRMLAATSAVAISLGMSLTAVAAQAASPPSAVSSSSTDIPTPGGLQLQKFGAMAPKAEPDAESDYAYSSTYVPEANLTTTTSGSVRMTIAEQGLTENDGAWSGNHSLANFVVSGTCATGNSGCTASPLLELTETVGKEYCKSGDFVPCFEAYTWKNGAWTHETGYVEESGGIPDNGTWHPSLGGTYTIGYELSGSDFDITINGTVVGYVPDSYWGQTTFGPITEESLQSEAYEATPDWGVSPQVSANYTFSTFTDSSGNTIPTPAVSTGFTLSNESGTGYTVRGGDAPTEPGTFWESEASSDIGSCLKVYNGTYTSGTDIVTASCATSEAEGWHYTTEHGLMENESGNCLADPGDSTTLGTQAVLQSCSDTAAQVWQQIFIGNGFIEYKNTGAGLCINNLNNGTANGTAVKMETCGNTQSNSWDSPDGGWSGNVTVPNEVGRADCATAQGVVAAAGLVPVLTGISCVGNTGSVTSESPAAGSSEPAGTTITLNYTS